jgi:glucose-6-phosphate isomerase
MGSHGIHHEILLSHACAQSEALMSGVDPGDPHRACPGNRVSTTIVLPRLDAYHVGALLAMYEHTVFVQACVWGINAFDQFGVELGKTIASRILPAVQGANVPLHPATAHLLGVIRRQSETH